MANFNDYFANMGANALQGAQAVGNALTQRRDIQNRMSLQGQLPALIEQYGVSNRNMSEEQKQANKQYLSLLANTNPEEAMKYLMQIQKESQYSKNYSEISRAIQDGLNAYKNAMAILEEANSVDKSQRGEYKKAYNVEFDNWLNAKSRGAQYDATDSKFDAMGKLGAFEDYFNDKAKREFSAKRSETDYQTALLNRDLAENKTKSIPLENESAKINLQSQKVALQKTKEDLKKVQTENQIGTAEQAKMGGYGSLMQIAEEVLSKGAPTTKEALYSSLKTKVPNFAGGFIKSSPYDIAVRAFINSKLRQESGAVIGADEFEGAIKQYIPEGGDSKEVLALKAKQRKAMIEMMVKSQGVSGQGGGAQPQTTPNARVSKKGRSS